MHALHVAVLMQGMAALMVFVIILLFFSTDPRSVANGVLFRQSMVCVVVFTVYFLAIVILGAEVNLTYVEHRKGLMRHITNTQNGISVISGKLRELKEAHGAVSKSKRKRRKVVGDFVPEDYTPTSTHPVAHFPSLSREKASEYMDELLNQEDKLQDVLEALLVAMDAVDQSTELIPVTFLRLESSYGLAYTILTTVLSFFVYVAAAIQPSDNVSA